jgi:hypothetical protein
LPPGSRPGRVRARAQGEGCAGRVGPHLRLPARTVAPGDAALLDDAEQPVAHGGGDAPPDQPFVGEGKEPAQHATSAVMVQGVRATHRHLPMAPEGAVIGLTTTRSPTDKASDVRSHFDDLACRLVSQGQCAPTAISPPATVVSTVSSRGSPLCACGSSAHSRRCLVTKSWTSSSQIAPVPTQSNDASRARSPDVAARTSRGELTR